MQNYTLSNSDISNIYKINNERKSLLLKYALEKPTKFEQLKYVVDYFLNCLSLSETAAIDNVSESKVVPFIYDYSFIEDFKTYSRTQKLREFTPGGFGKTLNVSIININDMRVYPSTFALKMGTCQMLASEIARFASRFGIECKVVSKITSCYDNFNGTNTNHENISTDQIVNMMHYYNIITIDNKELKIDIAGALTGLDYNNNHPENAIDLSKFYFSEDINNNPFDKIMKNSPPESPANQEVSVRLPCE